MEALRVGVMFLGFKGFRQQLPDLLELCKKAEGCAL